MEHTPIERPEQPEHREYYTIPYFYLILDQVHSRMAELEAKGDLPTTDRELTLLQHWLTMDTIANMLPLTLMDTQAFQSVKIGQSRG
ncbi:hypothetical protein IPM65_04755 [Candidatus Roizmanbacteria bacterium]|nr:MAG: hypothetical protein IPM65_04755 [Candidatus Roizmanbacteria bacterium]